MFGPSSVLCSRADGRVPRRGRGRRDRRRAGGSVRGLPPAECVGAHRPPTCWRCRRAGLERSPGRCLEHRWHTLSVADVHGIYRLPGGRAAP